MCGRYALFESMEYLRFLLDLEEDIPELLPRYNIAPSQAAPIAVPGSSVKRRIIQARFGFASDRRAPTSSQTQAHAASRPAQVTAALDLFGDPIVEKTKRPSGPPPKRTAADPIWINARAETVATLPSFRDAFQKRRCLIPASGFYEWKKTSAGTKQPFWIAPASGILVFAGIWEPPLVPGALPSYAILTTTPNSDVREIHDRMPLVLTAERFQPWLDPAAGSDVLAEILRATAEGFLHPREVSRMVNSPKNDGPECLEGPDDERHDD